MLQATENVIYMTHLMILKLQNDIIANFGFIPPKSKKCKISHAKNRGFPRFNRAQKEKVLSTHTLPILAKYDAI